MAKSKISGICFIGILIILTVLIQQIPVNEQQKSSVTSIPRFSHSEVDLSWKAHSLSTTGNLHAITGFDNQLWIAGANGALFHSIDAGVSWISRNTHFSGTWLSVTFINQSHGFISGINGAFTRSTDGGISWEMVNLGITANMASHTWINTTHGWMAGTSGVLLFTEDSGITWTARTIPWENDIESIYYYNNTLGWLVGANGLVARTQDGGINWNSLSTPVSTDWKSIGIDNTNSTWIAGTGGIVLRSQNYGNSWTSIDIGLTTTISTLVSVPTKTVMLAGYQGVCLGSTNSGVSWTTYDTGSTVNILSSYASSTSATGWLVGEYGLVLSKSLAPRVKITEPMNDYYTVNSVPLIYNVSYGLTSIILDGVSNTSALPSGSFLSSLGEGKHNLTILAVDTAGNAGKSTILFTVDTVVPSITITSPSNNTYDVDSIILTYSVSDGQTTIFLDSTANTTAIPSGSVLSSVTEGNHNLTIQSIDLAGNRGKNSMYFTIDTIAPLVTITNPINDTVGLDSITLTYSVSDGQTTIFLDNIANTTALPSGSVLSSLTEGSHNLTIQAIDTGGNIGSDTVLFTVDTISPVVTITNPANMTYPQSDVLVTYFVSGGTVSIYIDGNVNTTALPSGSVLSSLTEGSHNLTIQAIDIGGNIGTDTVFFTIDTIVPVVTIMSPVNITYSQSNVTLSYSTSEGIVTVYIDGVANTTSLSSGSIVSALAEGTHNVTVIAIDTAGNVGSSTYIFTVDTVAPSITITSPAPIIYNHASILITYTVFEAEMVTVYLDNIANTTVRPSGSLLSNLSEGNHNLTIIATDSVGNIRKSTVLFSVDTIVPIITITSPTSSTYTQNEVILTYSVSEGTTTIYFDNTANTSLLISGDTLSLLTNGDHNLTVWVIDSAGNIGQQTVIFTINFPITTTTTATTTTTTTPTTITTTTAIATTTTTTTSGAYASFEFLALGLLFLGLTKRKRSRKRD